MKRTALQHNVPANDAISYAGCRFPPDVFSYAVWLYYRLFMHCRYNANAQEKRQARTHAFEAWKAVTGNPMLDRLAS
jgi:hypothetical protein